MEKERNAFEVLMREPEGQNVNVGIIKQEILEELYHLISFDTTRTG
jgi:hypothetical protein